MKRSSFFIVVILGLILSGCSASFHMKKALQKDPDIIKRDTVINEIVFKLDTVIKIDTNILILLPRDTVKIEKLIPKYVSFKPVKKKIGIITTEVSAYKGNLKIVSYLDSTTWYQFKTEIRIKDAQIRELREVIIKQDVTIKKEKSLKEQFKTWFRWAKYIILGMIVLIMILILIKIFKWGFNKYN